MKRSILVICLNNSFSVIFNGRGEKLFTEFLALLERGRTEGLESEEYSEAAGRQAEDLKLLITSDKRARFRRRD